LQILWLKSNSLRRASDITPDYGIRYALCASLIARPRLAYKYKKEFVLNASIHPNSFFVFPVILGNSCGRWGERRPVDDMLRADRAGRRDLETTGFQGTRRLALK
jgi:hypothetical protein